MLVMDVSLFLFVVSQECSFSHAVNHTHGHTHTVLSLCKAQGEREEGDEGGAGVNLIPLGPNDTPETQEGWRGHAEGKVQFALAC